MTISTYTQAANGLPIDNISTHTVAATGNVTMTFEGEFDGVPLAIRFRKNLSDFGEFNDKDEFVTKPCMRVVFAPAGAIIQIERVKQQSSKNIMNVVAEILDA